MGRIILTSMIRCFYINLPIGGLAAATIFIFFQTPQAAKPVDATLREKLLQMDPLGMAVMMGAVISFILALQYGGARESWSSSTVVGLLVGFVLILIAFGILEVWQGERSMLTPRLMRDRNVWVNGLYGFFFCGAYFVPLYYLPIYFQSIDNISPLASGVRNLPLIIAFSVGAVVSGGAISKTGVAAPILTVSAVISTVAAGLLYTLDIGTGSGKWIGYQILLGLGFGVGFQVPIIIVQANAKPTDLASTTAIILCKYYSHALVKFVHMQNTDIATSAQFSRLSGALSSSLPRSLDSSTSFCKTLPGPPPALIQLWLWPLVPLTCTRCFRETN